MREALLKRRYGIPLALLILLVSAGVVTAVFVKTFAFSANMEEPLTFEKGDNLNIAYQGESGNIIVQVKNASAKQGYGIFVDTSVSDGQVVSLTYSSNPDNKLISTEQNEIKDVNKDGDVWDAWYNIEANENYEIVVTVDSADDIVSRNLSVKLDFHRKEKYPAP